MEGPWGKPGPGGTVWRNPRDIGLNFSKSMVKQLKQYNLVHMKYSALTFDVLIRVGRTMKFLTQ